MQRRNVRKAAVDLLATALLAAVLLPGPGCASGKKKYEPTCGDFLVEGEEECDNGTANNDVLPDACRLSCVLPRCGDMVVDTGEECDDGNILAGDGCNAACIRERECGDGVVDLPEECDDGNTVSGDGCSDACIFEFVCGDGVCDSTRHETCPLCPEDCCPCGDGVCDLSVGETCSLCHDDCCPDCGDGILDSAEQCDDGNLTDGDGCSAACVDEDGTPTCGNGIWEAGEECDDGNTTALDGCSDTCQWEFTCGDGICETANGETCPLCPADCCPCGDATCDTGAGETCAMCHTDCCPGCGNGVLDPNEECDDGNAQNGDGCSQHCEDEDGTPTCGNGLWELTEGCDDGNTQDGDGCSAACQIEFVCGDAACDTANGETCQLCQQDCCPSCGNAAIDAGEQCDGANLGGVTCANLCYTGGTATCTGWCTLDLSGCTGPGPSCGDGVAECGEACDGADLLGNTCASLGFAPGTLVCDSGCAFDVSSCGPVLAYLDEDFESGCPAGWSLGGDWQCGVPSGSGPGAAHSGATCLGTQLGGNYNNNQSWTTAVADAPPIVLPPTAEPVLVWWAWLHTEGSSFDGANVKISTNGGASYALLTTASVPYNLTVGGEQAWGGNYSANGWTQVTADLAAYVGQTVNVRFAFRTDSSVTYPGVYIDDVMIVEAVAVPLQITTTGITDALVGLPYSAPLQRSGGSGLATWSIAGGTNIAWLSVDPATGVLSGAPAPGDLGPAAVTVRVEEPLNPANFDEATYNFEVRTGYFFADFEGGCPPTGWALGGDWECGSPTSVGPPSAHGGTTCIGTQIDTSYSMNQSWTVATATTPSIDLTTATAPTMSWYMWVETEGYTYDGANLKVSTNGGGSWQIVTTVAPAYDLTVGGESAWGYYSGSYHVQWYNFTADLSAYVGQVIQLQFGFRTDSSISDAGVYVDDIEITE
ncbi:MAG: DUF4215 domain-containing protein [bacterium]